LIDAITDLIGESFEIIANIFAGAWCIHSKSFPFPRRMNRMGQAEIRRVPKG
jgi:hypothetical protein